MKKEQLINHYKRKIATSRRDTQDLYVEILGQIIREGSTHETMQQWAIDKKAELEQMARICQTFAVETEHLG
jgi:hypothetical protein